MVMHLCVFGDVSGTSVASKAFIVVYFNTWGLHDIKKYIGSSGGYFTPESAQMQKLP